MKRHGTISVTLLTGPPGSGKTTLLDRVLGEAHTERVAVVEDWGGRRSIDHRLLDRTEGDVLEMSNGCLCCASRDGDLTRALRSLMKHAEKLDRVLIELATPDPEPVATALVADYDLRARLVLERIVTLVDASTIADPLRGGAETAEEIAIADVVVINKVDLVDHARVHAIEAQVREINREAEVLLAERVDVPLSTLWGARVDDARPPFRWTGVYHLTAGRYELSIAEGRAPFESLVVLPVRGLGDDALRDGARWATDRFRESPAPLLADERIPMGLHVALDVAATARAAFPIEIGEPGLYAVYAGHTAQEIELRLCVADGARLTTGPALPLLAPPPPSETPLRLMGALVPLETEVVWGPRDAGDVASRTSRA